MKYKFVGNGMGVPGLPHEISDDEARELGVEEILKESVKNGNYAETPPLPLPKTKGKGDLGREDKFEKEVKHG